MVDLVDTKAKELVWRGMASRVVDADETPKTRDEKVQEAIDKLFEGFPPRK
jgi:predicted secreted protein